MSDDFVFRALFVEETLVEIQFVNHQFLRERGLLRMFNMFPEFVFVLS